MRKLDGARREGQYRVRDMGDEADAGMRCRHFGVVHRPAGSNKRDGAYGGHIINMAINISKAAKRFQVRSIENGYD